MKRALKSGIVMTVRDCREKKNGKSRGLVRMVKKSRGGNREVRDGKVREKGEKEKEEFVN